MHNRKPIHLTDTVFQVVIPLFYYLIGKNIIFLPIEITGDEREIFASHFFFVFIVIVEKWSCKLK